MLSRPFCMVADPNLNDGFRDSFSLIVVIIMSGIQQKRAWQKHYICSGLYLCLCFYSVFTKRKQNRLIEKYFSGVRYLRKAMLGNVLFFPLRILLVLYLRRVQPLLLEKTSENGFDGLLKGYKSKKMCSVFCEQTMTGQSE